MLSSRKDHSFMRIILLKNKLKLDKITLLPKKLSLLIIKAQKHRMYILIILLQWRKILLFNKKTIFKNYLKLTKINGKSIIFKRKEENSIDIKKIYSDCNNLLKTLNLLITLCKFIFNNNKEKNLSNWTLTQ